MECDIETSFNHAVEEAVNTLLALTKQDGYEEKLPEPSSAADVERKTEEAEKKEECINRIRRGWSSEDCGTVSIGELYLMVLHYTFFIVKEKLFHIFSLAPTENLH